MAANIADEKTKSFPIFFDSIAKSTDLLRSAGIEISDIIPPTRKAIDKKKGKFISCKIREKFQNKF